MCARQIECGNFTVKQVETRQAASTKEHEFIHKNHRKQNMLYPPDKLYLSTSSDDTPFIPDAPASEVLQI